MAHTTVDVKVSELIQPRSSSNTMPERGFEKEGAGEEEEEEEEDENVEGEILFSLFSVGTSNVEKSEDVEAWFREAK
jgi:hypothetical protein